MGRSSLEVFGLRRHLGGQVVLDGVSLRLEPGEFFGLVGPSGSGKSTLLRLIAGLDRPDGGEVRIGEKAATRLPPERRGVAVVFQHPLLFPHLTVAENVAFGLKMRRVSLSESRRRVEEGLASVRMESLGHRYPAELSGGQQQRVALARALAVQPEMLLLDEPFSHLDPALRGEMRALVRELHSRFQITTLMVTHDHDEALELSDRLGVLLAGRLVQVGRPAAVLACPATLAVATFLRAGNLVPGRVVTGRFESGAGGGPMPGRPGGGPEGWPEGGPGGWPDGPAWAIIPPERLRVRPPGEGAPAEVLRAYPSTGGTVIEVRVAGQILTARPALAPGRPQDARSSDRSAPDPWAPDPWAPDPWAPDWLVPGNAVSLTWDSASTWYVYE